MDVKQNPFSFYDFLGYFTPGAIFLYSTMIVYGHALDPATPFAIVQKLLGAGMAELYVPFILMAYLTGHFLSYVSSVTVERYSVWTLGYPSKYLLGEAYPRFFDVAAPKFLRAIGHVIGALALLPIAFFDFLLGRLLNLRDLYAKPLDEFLSDVLKAKVIELATDLDVARHVNGKGGLKQHDYFRIAYHYAVESCPRHFPKMQNYVALYGFLRTITLVLVVVFWAYLWHVFYFPTTPFKDFAIASALAFVAYVSYAAFAKFYRRFSLETLMAISVRSKSTP